MKIKPYEVEKFLRAPMDGVRALLIYGPDAGLVRLTAERAIKALLGDSADPFNLRTLSAERAAQDVALLTKEAAHLSLGGGRVVVRLAQATEACTKALAHLLAAEQVGGVAVISAGALTPRSALRRLAEKEKSVAAIACYADNPKQIEALIAKRLKAASLQIAPDALAFFVQRLGADRAISENEIEKLILYMGDEPIARIEDVIASTGDMAQIGLDDLADCVGLGDVAGAARAWERLTLSGFSPIAMVMSLNYHFQKLRFVLSALGEGQTLAAAMNRLAPPIHFTRKDKFSRQCQIWDLAHARLALMILWEANIAERRLALKPVGAHMIMAIAARASRMRASKMRASRRR